MNVAPLTRDHESTKSRSRYFLFRVFRAFGFSCLLIASLSLDALAQSKRAMTVDDVIDLAQVSSPRLSPDGRRVLYTVSELGKW